MTIRFLTLTGKEAGKQKKLCSFKQIHQGGQALQVLLPLNLAPAAPKAIHCPSHWPSVRRNG